MNINLRLVKKEDAQFILELRINNELNKFLSAVANDLNKQIKWIEDYKQRELKREEHYFIIESKNSEKHGTIRAYDFRKDSFCWGSWIVKKDSPIYVGIESVLLVYKFGFYDLGFNKSHFEVRKANERVVSFHKRFGAGIVGSDELNYYFEINKETFEEAEQKYKKYST